MCGIVAYLGNKSAYPILVKGLQRLEYRGYDSAGIALINDDLKVFKKKGRVMDLMAFAEEKETEGTIGMGHTRWATHGAPNDINAHPHTSNNNRLAIIHNGIIENYSLLKEALAKKGHTFKSDTDTEVLVNLIEEIQNKDKLPLEEAVRIALTRVVGAYAIVVLDKTDPNKMVAARKASPLVIGIGEEEYFLASDATPFVEYTKKVIYLNDGEIATVERGKEVEIKNIDNVLQTPSIQEIDMDIESIEKEGYDYFMLKEIHEQVQTVADCMRGRLNLEEGWIKLGGMGDHMDRILNAERIIFAACGTSWHAGLIGEYLFEELARIPVEVEYASELRYRNPIITEKDLVIAISQSGETADTLAALEIAKERGALLYGIVNVVGSSIARLTHAGSYIHAGPEIGVASTKAFTGQVALLSLMALSIGRRKGTLSESLFRQYIAELASVPTKIEQVLKQESHIKYIAAEIKDRSNALYLGRGYNFPIALEGALKLKEISYIHAEGYPAAEMKHGPIALIDKQMPVIVIASNKRAKEKILSNIQEVKARQGFVIAIVNEGDKAISEIADHVIRIPEIADPFSPLLSVIPLQLLSYHVAVLRDCDVDRPRNLAKSVTVE